MLLALSFQEADQKLKDEQVAATSQDWQARQDLGWIGWPLLILEVSTPNDPPHGGGGETPPRLQNEQVAAASQDWQDRQDLEWAG